MKAGLTLPPSCSKRAKVCLLGLGFSLSFLGALVGAYLAAFFVLTSGEPLTTLDKMRSLGETSSQRSLKHFTSQSTTNPLDQSGNGFWHSNERFRIVGQDPSSPQQDSGTTSLESKSESGGKEVDETE